MKKYAVFSSVGGHKRKVFSSKKEASAYYSKEVKKLEKKTGVVHIKNAETHCVIKGKYRDPRQKAKNITPECNW